jgi:uncharacterized protein YrrD
MQFRKNAHVLTRTGKRVGRVHRVVVDPASREVTHLVVKKGLLFKEDKVVPVSQVDTTAEDTVVLQKGATDPDRYPTFDREAFIPVGGYEDFREKQAEEARSLIWYHTGISTPWWVNGLDERTSKPLFVRKGRRSIPEGAVPLEEGARVLDAGGAPVGKVVKVYAEPQEHRVTHIVIARGILDREEKLIPSAWIEQVLEDSVRLTVAREFVAGLPPAEEAQS